MARTHKVARSAAVALVSLMAAVTSFVAATPAQAALEAGAQLDVTGCSYPSGQIVAGNVMHQYFSTTAAFYAGAYVPTSVPGGHFQIRGRYPKSGWFDWTTNSNKVPLNTLGAIDDVNIAPDLGSTNPYKPGVTYDPNNNYYTINVKDSPIAGRTPQQNVLWGGWAPDPVIPTSWQKVNGELLLYYLEGATQDPSLMGGVGLPSISWVVDNPSTNPYQTVSDVCSAMYTAGGFWKYFWAANKVLDQNWWEQIDPAILNTYDLPVPGLLQGPSLHPEASVIRPSPGGYWWPLFNQQAVYLGFKPSELFGKFYTVRFKAPTFDSIAYGTPRTGSEQTQFWSWCTGSVWSPVLYIDGCVNDYDAHPDANGYVTLVVSPPDQRPVMANGKPYPDWIPWAGSGGGIAWEIVDPNDQTFPQNPGRFPQSMFQHVPLAGDWATGANPLNVLKAKSLMGPYYPVVRYCTKLQVEAGNFCQS